MDRHPSKFASLAVLFLLLTALVACGPSSPEDVVAAKRADYTIELNSWRVVEEEPAVPVEDVASVEGEGEEEGEEVAAIPEEVAAAPEEVSEAAAGPQPVAVEFDLVIYFRGTESLPGITVDVTQADAQQQEKAIFRQWVDTEGIVKGETRQAAFVIEGLEVADGDIFAASVKPGIPAELALYREFSP